ncbi:hypothetical protein [Photobacterium sp. TY1-4]|uniref:hypothetical protein n=1 Tax=Photobacterium sp. TY1-4 TaxID=2899122 RepID=UPI0021C21CF9|nr:hypothetical protein [Photobacterium sp. TY1-4]UXI04439.1 hypothetical protein NH461_20345 [Photobacterium sp. TY1-4]
MHIFYRLLVLIPLLSPLVQAQPLNVLPDNEKLCMEAVGRLLARQQAIFSNSQAEPNQRRLAERAIDTTREAFSESESYCQAQAALQAYESQKDKDDSFQQRQGEVNYFGRSTI